MKKFDTFEDILAEEGKKPYFKALNRRGHAAFLPKVKQRLRAFKLTPMEAVRVVILGESPYPQPGVADGLAFSTENSSTPPVLRNIYKELERDLGIKRSTNSLEGWARQGVLLMNTALTAEAFNAGAHSDAWLPFTRQVCKKVILSTDAIWLLWGRKAQGLFQEALMEANGESHMRLNPARLEAAHPAPVSASAGFHGCGHFGAVNEVLNLRQDVPIDWGRE